MLTHIDQLRFTMDQKAGIADVKANFKELGDLLHAKFSLLEDCSEGLRDVLVY